MRPWCLSKQVCHLASPAVASTMHHCCWEGEGGRVCSSEWRRRPTHLSDSQSLPAGHYGKCPGGRSPQGRADVCSTLHSAELPDPSPPTGASAGVPQQAPACTPQCPHWWSVRTGPMPSLWLAPLCARQGATCLRTRSSTLVACAHDEVPAVSSHHCLWVSQPCPVMDLTVSQVGKLRHRAVRELAQGHTAGTWGQDSNLFLTQV